MRTFLFIFLILISLAITVLILLQQRSGGAGAVFGSSTEIYRTRRGVEKIFHYLTIILTLLFSVVAFGLIFAD